MSVSYHFSFLVLVDKVTKNKNRLCDFLYDVFHLQGKTGKTKMKNDKKQTNYYVIFSFFRNFCQPKNWMKSSLIQIVFKFYADFLETNLFKFNPEFILILSG